MCAACAAAVLALAGCAGPLERSLEQQMHEQMVQQNKAYLDAVGKGPVIEVSRPPSDVEAAFKKDDLVELDRMSGPTSYKDVPLRLGTDLTGVEDTPTVAMTLKRAIELATKNNLNLSIARIRPAFSQTQVTQAEARFDAVYFANLEHQKLDTPRPAVVGAPPAFGSQQTENTQFSTGIRKLLTTGGQVSVETGFSRIQANPSFFAPTGGAFTYYASDISLSINQPLLRGFGDDVNRAEILLARSAREQSVQELRAELLRTLADTERAFWTLVFARHRLQILVRLYERTVEDRDVLKRRGEFDVSPVRITEANSFVELRRSDVIRARQDVRRASDALKRLINDEQLPLSGETLIVPLETPADVPIQYSLLDAVRSAVENRPEVRAALMQIKDASIRQRVADNLRLPQLDVGASIIYNGIDSDNIGDAYGNLFDGDFIDYIISAQFEVPIGNRGPEALHQQRKIERQAAVINYQNTVQTVVLEVKDALRSLITSYELIGSSRAARRAASDNLRAIIAREEAGEGLTPEFLLDQKLAAQGRVADAETQEAQALTDYNSSIADLYRAMGTLTERNGIEFKDPEGEKR